MKRYGKVFIMSLLSIFALAVPVFAREMTPEELGNEAKKQVPGTSYVYVIGEYAFTSEHTLTTQDVMLAARSIETKDKTGKTDKNHIYNEMTIFTVKGEYNDSMELTGWKLVDNVIGTSKLEDLENKRFNIRYIDYNYVKDIYKVTLNLDGGKLPEGKENSLNVLEGDKIDQTLITGKNRPTQVGKQFKEWVLVKEDNQEEKWDFNKEVTGNMTLKATWYDEVNTDTLIENAKKAINEGTKKNGYYYDVDFEKQSKTVTFKVYDLNQKNSEIKGTGLIGDIVNIVNAEHVKSITISTVSGNVSVEFDEDDVNNGAGPDSNAWKQFALLLCKLTGKECDDADKALQEFVDIKLGDLIEKDLKLTITLDENNARSQNDKVAEDYKIEFSYNAKATIGKNISENDKKELEEQLKYTPEGTYNIQKTADGLYKVTGYVTEQEDVTGFGDRTSGFYFAYTITLDNNEIDASKAKVKIPTDDTGKNYNEATFDTTTRAVTVLMEVEESEVEDDAQNGYRDIIVEVDGVPTKIRIDFTGLKLRKSSKFGVEDAKDNGTLQTNYGWTKPSDYDVKFSGTTTNENSNVVKVTGLLPIHDNNFTNDKAHFGKDHETGYYIAFAIKTKNNKDENNTKVEIKDKNETITATSKDFDENQALYVLKHLHPDADPKTFTIEIDMDGEETKYEPYKITVDWSELKLQVDSVATVKLDQATATDKETMQGWGYTTPEEQNVTLKDGMLTGKLVEQTLTSDDAFGAKNKDGFYFDFTIKHPDGVELDKDKIEITRVKTHKDIGTDLQDGNVIKKFTSKDLDDNNDLTILYRFPKDTTSCIKCTEKETCDNSCCGENGVCDKVLYYVVDWDGAEGKEYLPVIYSIDYCGVTFEKSSIFTVAALSEDKKDEFETNDSGAWYDTKNGYSVNVEQDKTDAKKYKVTGVLPIFNDDDGKYSDTFNTKDNLYYLGLLLKLVNVNTAQGDPTSSINVKFFHSGENDDQYLKVFDHEFNSTNELYILKALCETAKNGGTIKDEEKVFTITLDLDGEDDKEYIPYTVTIDWSGLKLQSTSAGNFGNYEVATQANIGEDEEAVKQLQSFGYNYETSKEVTIKTENIPEHGKAKRGLQGKIKEQTLKEGFKNNEGYFVPIKVEFPGKGDESMNEYSHTWTLILNTEDGQTKIYTPTKEEYDQGWVLVLFRMEKDGGSRKISYKIDFDGEKFAFLPEEYTIDYSELQFAEAHKVTFKGIDAEPITVWDGDKITEDLLPEAKPKAEDYHEFAYWNKEDGTKFDSIGFTYEGDKEAGNKETGDITLVPHWNLYSDKFISDVLEDLNKTEDSQSQDFSDEFIIEDYEENSGKITITVKDPTIPLSRMNDTSIPGAIAYILLKDEIQEITLSVNGEEKTFTKGDATDKDDLKGKVIEDAKELYSSILSTQFEGKDDNTVTLSDLAHKEGYESFTLKFNPEKVEKTVTLTKAPAENGISLTSMVDVPTNYEFTFKSKAIIVKNQKELTNALSGNAEQIFIGADFNVTNSVTVNRKVVINGGTDKHTLTASGADTIFNVTSAGVTIDNIKLANAKTPIVVSSGILTSTGITVEGQNTEAAFEVKKGATLTASQLTYDGENYEKPAVKAEKEGTTVEFTDSETKPATKLEKIERIEKYEEQSQKDQLGDTKKVDNNYNYHNYYNKVENSKIYKTTFHNHEARKMATFVRYNYHGEKVEKPYSQTPFTVFDKFNYDGYTYTLIGFANNRDKTVNFNYDKNLPEGVVKPDEITATSDNYYYAAYSVALKEGVTKVKTAQDLSKAIKEQSNVTEIYIDTTDEIDLSSEEITIDRKLSIIGPSKTVKLKVKGIKVTADDVFLHRLNIEVDTKEDAQALIDISGSASQFTLWQCSLKNVSKTAKVDNAIRYSGTTAIVDIRWNTFYAENIKNTFVNIDTALAGVTDIYGNTFKKLTLNESKKNAITIKNFDTSAKMNDDDETIRITSNTFDSSDYAIEISKEASGKEADISLKTSQQIGIAVKYDEEHNQFGKINIHHTEDVNKIKITYIDREGHTSDRLASGEGIKIVVPVEMASSQVPEQAVIEGLKLNGNTYSGTINQSEDGKFYLPVTLTSNNFKNNVSTVKVTNPNGEEKTYTYNSNSKDGIATVNNANTMNLQLEAIKSSKITGKNGKVYKLELDADGAKSNNYQIKEYTIDYSEVETLEEKINQAAQSTLEANSFTVTKNNKINGYTEEFTYQYNAKDGLTYLKADKDNVEEYTFAVKYAGVTDSSSKLSVVARKSKVNEEDGKVYINDWVYVHPLQVGTAIHELTMLTDVMKETKTAVNAIDKVEEVKDKDHTYKVTLNRDKYNEWVKDNYLSNSNYTSAEWALNKTVVVDVVLDDSEQYIKSIKTHQESSTNTFDVTFTDVNKTDIKKPTEFLSTKEKQLTDEDIKKFYEDGKKWWDEYIHKNAYKQ